MARWILKFASYKDKDDIFNTIKDGTKTIETRPYNPTKKRNYSTVKPGDTLVFDSLDSGKKIEKTATSVKVYPSVDEMLAHEDAGKIFPGKTTDELRKVYDYVKKKWGKSYTYKLDHYGIVTIRFK